MVEMTVRAFWEESVRRWGPRRFVYYEGNEWTYAEFDRDVNQAANRLRSLGLVQGDKIAFFLPSTAEFLIHFLAVHKLGAILIPIIMGSTFPEVEYIMNNSEATFLVTDAENWQVVREGRQQLAGLRQVVLLAEQVEPGTVAMASLSGSAEPPPTITTQPNDDMGIMYTSGSTGRPKGVILSQASFATCGTALSARIGYTGEDTIMCVLPIFHAAASHMTVPAAIAVGAALCVERRFSRARFWKVADDAGATKGLLLPHQLSPLMSEPESPVDGTHTFKLMFSHIRPEAFVRRFNIDVLTTWAMTETGGMGTLTVPNYDRYEPQLIGWPFPDDAEMKVVDENGRTLPPGVSGELCFRHPAVMKGYYNNPEKTADALRDGWVHSGDLGRMDPEGRVYFEGRLKNVIKRSGENISGEELEFAILAHPKVEEVIALGVADPIRTEEVMVIVVPSPDQAVRPEEVISWCKERLASWKVPRYVAFQDEPLAKLANGKVKRADIVRSADPGKAWDRLQVLPQ